RGYRLDLGGGSDGHRERRKLIEELDAGKKGDKDLQGFVSRGQVQTLATVDRLQEVLQSTLGGGGYVGPVSRRFYATNSLPVKMELVAGLVAKGFGTRVFYVSINGFDTHSDQATQHQNLLAEVADGIAHLFEKLRETKDDRRVR